MQLNMLPKEWLIAGHVNAIICNIRPCSQALSLGTESGALCTVEMLMSHMQCSGMIVLSATIPHRVSKSAEVHVWTKIVTACVPHALMFLCTI